jgi:hypothetical protein
MATPVVEDFTKEERIYKDYSDAEKTYIGKFDKDSDRDEKIGLIKMIAGQIRDLQKPSDVTAFRTLIKDNYKTDTIKKLDDEIEKKKIADAAKAAIANKTYKIQGDNKLDDLYRIDGDDVFLNDKLSKKLYLYGIVELNQKNLDTINELYKTFKDDTNKQNIIAFELKNIINVYKDSNNDIYHYNDDLEKGIILSILDNNDIKDKKQNIKDALSENRKNFI